MRCKVTQAPPTIHIELSRRNLRSLLAKLDDHPANSSATIYQDNVVVTAVEDDEHYFARSPGCMHPETEAAIAC